MASRVENRREQALRWVNDIREQHNVEPLENLSKGLRTWAGGCPLANSLRDCWPREEEYIVTVYRSLIVSKKPGSFTDELLVHREELPKEVFGFVKDFDLGKHPDLIV